jgi:hypothetical protein
MKQRVPSFSIVYSICLALLLSLKGYLGVVREYVEYLDTDHGIYMGASFVCEN